MKYNTFNNVNMNAYICKAWLGEILTFLKNIQYVPQ